MRQQMGTLRTVKGAEPYLSEEDRSRNRPAGTDLRQEIAGGLLYAHSRLSAGTSKTLEVASFLYALVELLTEKGVITVEELDERKRVVGERLVEQFRKHGVGVVFQDLEYGKYAFEHEVEIDCACRGRHCLSRRQAMC